MDDLEGDDADMMAMMGMSGFGSTKVKRWKSSEELKLNFPQGKQVEGNQEGGVKIKNVRTWRQYMNRYVLNLVHKLLFDRYFLF